MERVLFWKKVASVANAYRDTKVHDAKLISMIAMTTNARTMEHVSMESSHTHAIVCLALPASFARRKSNFAELNSIHAQTALNVLTTSHIIRASVQLVSVA